MKASKANCHDAFYG
jgi:hypothetical protein